MLTMMFDGEYIAIQLRDPLPALHRHFKMTYCVADVGFHLAPKEAGIALGDVGWAGITKLLVDANLGELVKECIELPRIERVSELSDQIRGAHQASLRVGLCMIPIVWHREAGQFDRTRNPLTIDPCV